MPKKAVMLVVNDIKGRAIQKNLMNFAIADEVSSVFNVSFEAATYRLKQLGVIPQTVKMSNDIFEMMFQIEMVGNF